MTAAKIIPAMKIVCTGNLNKAVRRNLSRHPAEFLFQLTAEEADSLRFHFGILEKGLHFKYLPNIFSGISVHARPHPGPLPRGEGERPTSLDNFSIIMAVTDSGSFAVRRMITQPIAWLKTRRTILPLLGERAGVRADASLIPQPVLFLRHPLKTSEKLSIIYD